MSKTQALFAALFLVAATAAAAFFLVGGGAPDDGPRGGAGSSSATEGNRDERPTESPEAAAVTDHGDTEMSREQADDDVAIAERTEGDVEASEEDRSITVTGRVVNEAGAPVPGVPVALTRRFVFGPGEPRRDAVETDQDGRFSLRGDHSGSGLVVRATPASLVRATANVPSDARGEFDVGEMVVAYGGSLSGTVRDDTGQPIAGAEVGVLRGRSSGSDGLILMGDFGGPQERTTETDASGRYQLDAVAAGEVALVVSREGFTRGSRKGVVVRKGEVTRDVDVEISRGQVIRGVIVGTNGQPVEGARVHVQETVIDLSEPGMGALIGGDRAVTTDANGVFELSGLKEEQYHVYASKDGLLPTSATNVAAGSTDLRLALEPSGMVYGYAIDVATDEPLDHFDVTVSGHEGGFYGPGVRVRSEATVHRGAEAAKLVGVSATDGLFVVSSLPSREVDVVVEADGYVRYRFGPVTVEPGKTARVDAELTPAVSVAGVVVDPDGNPVAGARVTLSPSQDEGGDGSVRIRRVSAAIGDDAPGFIGGPGVETQSSDQDGRFKLDGLKPGRYDLLATHRDWAASDKTTLTLEEGRPIDDIRVVLNVGGAVTGIVYAPDGEVAPGARVTLTERTDPTDEADVASRLIDAWSSGPQSQNATADGDGRYEVRGLKPGAYVATAKPKRKGGAMGNFAIAFAGFGGESPDGAPVTVEAGETATLDLSLPATGRLEGLVMNGGAPLPNAGVKLSKKDSHMPSFGGPNATTDDRGEFVIEDVEPGEYKLVLSGIQAALPIEEDVEVRPRETARVSIEVPTGTISGTVEDIDTGEPLAGIRVSASKPGTGGDGGGGPTVGTRMAFVSVAATPGGGTTTMRFGDEEEITETDANGYYELKRLAPGSYDVEAAGGGVAKMSEEGVRVEEGVPTTGIDFKATRGARLTVRVVGPGNADLDFFRLSYYDLASPGDVETRMEAGSDSTVIEGLAPGRYHIEVRDQSHKGEEEVEVASGEDKTVTIHLR